MTRLPRLPRASLVFLGLALGCSAVPGEQAVPAPIPEHLPPLVTSDVEDPSLPLMRRLVERATRRLLETPLPQPLDGPPLVVLLGLEGRSPWKLDPAAMNRVEEEVLARVHGSGRFRLIGLDLTVGALRAAGLTGPSGLTTARERDALARALGTTPRYALSGTFTRVAAPASTRDDVVRSDEYGLTLHLTEFGTGNLAALGSAAQVVTVVRSKTSRASR